MSEKSRHVQPDVARIGPAEDTQKYGLQNVFFESQGVVAWRGTLAVAETHTAVAVWMIGRNDETDASWMDQVAAYSSVRHHGIVSIREGFLAPPVESHPSYDRAGAVRCLVTNWVEGEAFDRWLRQRPARDAVGVVSLLIPVAGALDLLHAHAGQAGPLAHGCVRPAAITITADQTATLSHPPLTLLHSALEEQSSERGYVAPEVLAGEQATPAADTYGFAGVVLRILTGEDPPESDAESVVGAPAGISAARALRADERPVNLVGLLADLRGATITPGVAEVSGALPRAHAGLPSGNRPFVVWAAVGLGLIVAASVLVWAVLRDRDESGSSLPVAGALPCIPDAHERDAEDYLTRSGTAFAWTDPDSDCLHTAYEIHWIGSDYLVADPAYSGALPTAEMQIRVLMNFYEDITVIRGLNPGRCEPAAVATVAADYIDRTGLLITWVDTDADCLHDIWELNGAGTDPLLADTDGDGTVDSLDPKGGNGGMLVPVDEQLIFATDVHARNQMDPQTAVATDPSACEPDAWARGAQTYLAGIDIHDAPWDDPDGDCVHSVYELDVLGTDPDLRDTDADGLDDGNDPDHGDGMIPPLDRQYDHVVRVGS